MDGSVQTHHANIPLPSDPEHEQDLWQEWDVWQEMVPFFVTAMSAIPVCGELLYLFTASVGDFLPFQPAFEALIAGKVALAVIAALVTMVFIPAATPAVFPLLALYLDLAAMEAWVAKAISLIENTDSQPLPLSLQGSYILRANRFLANIFFYTLPTTSIAHLFSSVANTYSMAMRPREFRAHSPEDFLQRVRRRNEELTYYSTGSWIYLAFTIPRMIQNFWYIPVVVFTAAWAVISLLYIQWNEEAYTDAASADPRERVHQSRHIY